MCIQRDPYNWSSQLYIKYTDSIKSYCTNVLKPSLDNIVRSGHSDITLMNSWSSKWYNYNLIIKGLSKLFMYLDRFYTPNTENVLPLREQGYKIYYDNIFAHFYQNVQKCILTCISKERQNELQDRHLLQQCVNVFIEIGQYTSVEQKKKLDVYKDTLEKQLIVESNEYYSSITQEWYVNIYIYIYCVYSMILYVE